MFCFPTFSKQTAQRWPSCPLSGGSGRTRVSFTRVARLGSWGSLGREAALWAEQGHTVPLYATARAPRSPSAVGSGSPSSFS